MKPRIGKKILLNATPGILFILFLLIIQLFQWEFNDLDLYKLGIYPKHPAGMVGILFSPLIHGSFKHLLSNMLPLVILSTLIFFSYDKIALRAIGIIWIISGFFTWIIARENYHIGASGLIYGMAFFLFFSGIFRKNRALSALSLLTVFLYGGLVWNMTPLAELAKANTSWEGHLSGAIAGLLAAWILKNKGPQPDPILVDDLDEDPNEETIDIDEDAFSSFQISDCENKRSQIGSKELDRDSEKDNSKELT